MKHGPWRIRAVIINHAARSVDWSEREISPEAIHAVADALDAIKGDPNVVVVVALRVPPSEHWHTLPAVFGSALIPE